MARVMTIAEYEKRTLARLLREAGVDPSKIIEKFFERRERYCARLLQKLSTADPELAAKMAEKLFRSPNLMDKTLGAWLANRTLRSAEPLPTLYA